MTLDSASGANPVDRFVGRGSRGIATKVTTSLQEHVIDGNSASSILVPSQAAKWLKNYRCRRDDGGQSS
jgi:hypothetical protein